MVKSSYKKGKINSGPVGDGKLIILFNLYDYTKDLRGELERHAYKFECNHRQSYVYMSVREFNRIVDKQIQGNPMYCNCRIDSWGEVVNLLRNYISNFGNPSIKEKVLTFFRYMPFIDIKADGLNYLDAEDDFGYCCEDCDGSHENFVQQRRDLNLMRFFNGLANWNIQIKHK